MRATRKTASPTGLFWSERGEITCERHAPYHRSDTWNWNRWRALGVQEAEAGRDQTGELPECECCGVRATLPPF